MGSRIIVKLEPTDTTPWEGLKRKESKREISLDVLLTSSRSTRLTLFTLSLSTFPTYFALLPDTVALDALVSKTSLSHSLVLSNNSSGTAKLVL